ncbi:MAG: hypothetical protein ABUK01_07830 [Leptospirales bacterium]
MSKIPRSGFLKTTLFKNKLLQTIIERSDFVEFSCEKLDRPSSLPLPLSGLKPKTAGFFCALKGPSLPLALAFQLKEPPLPHTFYFLLGWLFEVFRLMVNYTPGGKSFS